MTPSSLDDLTIRLGRSLPVMVTQRDGKSDANDWSARMQMGGQVRAITQITERHHQLGY